MFMTEFRKDNALKIAYQHSKIQFCVEFEYWKGHICPKKAIHFFFFGFEYKISHMCYCETSCKLMIYKTIIKYHIIMKGIENLPAYNSHILRF